MAKFKNEKIYIRQENSLYYCRILLHLFTLSLLYSTSLLVHNTSSFQEQYRSITMRFSIFAIATGSASMILADFTTDFVKVQTYVDSHCSSFADSTTVQFGVETFNLVKTTSSSSYNVVQTDSTNTCTCTWFNGDGTEAGQINFTQGGTNQGNCLQGNPLTVNCSCLDSHGPLLGPPSMAR